MKAQTGGRRERYLSPWRLVCLVVLAAFVLLLGSAVALLADSVCAVVKIVILQELTFERVAFDAFLAITNNLPDQPLDNFQVTVTIKTVSGEAADDKFFVRVLSLDKVSAVDGTGRVDPGVRSEVHWLIIPSAGAGGTDPVGQQYRVGATITFTAHGLPQTIKPMPDTITVRPQPQLVLDYFLPAFVEGDDPFTEEVEPPVPFALAVRVKNDGFGPANRLKISSAQPKIVENKQGLLIDFRLLGSQIDGKEVTPSLTLQFGNILPAKCSLGRWSMISTLLGEFKEFNATFTHASELGGELTSLLKQTNTSFLVHEVLVDLPGRDDIVDYLVNSTKDHLAPPDRIFESSCEEQPVSSVPGTTAPIPGAGPNLTVTVPALSGWVHTKVPDPTDGNTPLKEVIRSDGKRLKPQNFWQSREKDLVIRTVFHHHVQLLDFDTTGSYTLVFEAPPADTTPPVTTVVITEPRFGADPVFVTSDTRFIPTATDDISGVAAVEYKLSRDTAFLAFFPFSLLPVEGPETITYRSRDRAGNQEADHTLNVVVDNSPPALDAFTVAPGTLVPNAPPGATVPRETVVTLRATDAISSLTAVLDIARGTGPEFSALPRVRTISAPLTSGVARPITWDGRNDGNLIVPEGTYTIRATVTDPLGHPTVATRTVEVREFLPVAAVEPADSDQINPAVSGVRVVWQDNRNGDWDIFLKDLETGALSNLTAGQAADQERPDIDGSFVVWQDKRNGNSDLFLHDIASASTRPLVVAAGDQERPRISGPWVVYQDNAAGNWDIYAINIETGEQVRITDHERDQINPAISGTTVVWEDYRHGLGEIYAFDLGTRTERRITNNVHSQITPTISGAQIVWVDLRNGNRDLYTFNLLGGRERRLTFTGTDEAEPHLDASRLVYTDFVAGLGNPNVALLKMAVPRRVQLLSDPARQEHPRLSGIRVVWQDNRSGRFQIMTTTLDTLPSRSLHVPIESGFNLLAITDHLAVAPSSAFGLLPALAATIPVRSIHRLDETTGTIESAEAPTMPRGTDFALREGHALVVISDGKGEVVLEEPLVCQPRPLRRGINFVGVSCLAEGYTAFTVLETVGLDVAVSVSRIESETGRWQTAAVKDGQPVGENFVINAGEGFLLHVTAPVAGWEP